MALCSMANHQFEKFEFTPLRAAGNFDIISNFTAETVNKVAAYHTSFGGDRFHSRPFFQRKGIGK
jgi:hypothetical protein